MSRSAAVRDRVGIKAFRDDIVDDPAVQALWEGVSFVVNDTLDYDSHEAVVRVETGDSTVERRPKNPPGTHDDLLPEADFRAKFMKYAGTVLADERCSDKHRRAGPFLLGN